MKNNRNPVKLCEFDALALSPLGSCFHPMNMGGVDDLFYVDHPNGDFFTRTNGQIELFTLLCPVPLAVGDGGTVITLNPRNLSRSFVVPLTFGTHTDGYSVFGDHNAYGIPSQRVHRLVYEAFFGEIPDNLEIDHIDGDKKNNDLDNLEAVSHSVNIARSWARERKPRRKYEPEVRYLLVHKSLPPVVVLEKDLSRVTSSTNVSGYWKGKRLSLNGWYPMRLSEKTNAADIRAFLNKHHLNRPGLLVRCKNLLGVM